jgi:hypothetical protein
MCIYLVGCRCVCLSQSEGQAESQRVSLTVTDLSVFTEQEGAVIPAATPQAIVRCLYDYTAHSPKELSFAKDEALTVLQQHNR